MNISKFVPYVGDEAYGHMRNTAEGKDVPVSAFGETRTPFVLLSQHFMWREEI